MSSKRSNALREKLADRRGETLIEVLVAVLVSSMAMLMLYTSITISMDIIKKGNTETNKYYAESNVLAGASGTSTSGTVTVEGPFDINGTHDPVTVTYHKPEGVSIVSYETSTSPTAGPST